ncbi:MAG TPA: transcriptional repressor [Verrucomicrobiales bacterium]|jgi:Fur family peroxide stress response transcriptional regulator|nr:transcriptional repressor [Deltaproteobacteria bacterium]HAT18962.1 transcriptional repressor [Verrucomicrobiales bacterium]
MVSNDGEALPTAAKEIPPELQGLRMTKQRWRVYSILLHKRDHPTANEVFRRVQAGMPTISLATVYNCLDALVDHGLITRVNFDREPSRFCVNLSPHVHFQDKKTGVIHDLSFKDGCQITDVLDLPNGVEVSELELTIRGFLPKGS